MIEWLERSSLVLKVLGSHRLCARFFKNPSFFTAGEHEGGEKRSGRDTCLNHWLILEMVYGVPIETVTGWMSLLYSIF